MTEFTETNRKHFEYITRPHAAHYPQHAMMVTNLLSSKVASTHQNDFHELIQTAIRQIQARRHWIGSKWTDTTPDTETRLLDYACGAGTVSKALAPFVSQTIGLDLSANMIKEYNDAADELGLHGRMQGYQYDLLFPFAETNAPLPSGTLSRFDVIAVGMALHHVSEPAKLLRKFAEHLKPSGVCVVLDMVPGHHGADIEGVLEPEQLDVVKTIGKRGFSEEEMRALYAEAGIGRKFEYVVIEERFQFTMFGREFWVTGFLARGELA
ncbi:S-adenosyl-L-methionine-dependent methyltransferase [Aspergillus recurvatus]